MIDPDAPIQGPEDRAAIRGFLDALVVDGGASVRILPSTGSPTPPFAACLPGDDPLAGGLTFAWGADFVVDPDAAATLDCILDLAWGDPFGPDSEEDLMFTGLMFPILDHPDWPPEDASLALAILLGDEDDDEHNMYGRPGMASEAYLRLGTDGERHRALGLATGRAGDELHMFTLSLGDLGAYHDWDDGDTAVAFAAFQPVALQACSEADDPIVPEPPGGCEQLDVLFVIDGSLSMLYEQDALRGANGEPPVFADFTDALLEQLVTLQDIRVGVVSSEPGDVVLHTSINYPLEPIDATTDCGLPPGQPWASAPSLNFVEDFACIAATRQASTVETTVLNAAQALGANPGFVRDDSVLMVVMLTDEDTQDWDVPMVEMRQMMLDAVGGNLDRIIVLAIDGDVGLFEMPKTTCGGPYGTATPGRRTQSVVASFREHGITQDICAGEMAMVFEAVLDDVVDTCMDWHPEG